jgi:hypothetical protein
MKATTTVWLSRSRIADVLCSGMEGGIGYWAAIVRYDAPPEGVELCTFWRDSSLGDEVFRHIHYPMCEAGGGVVLEHDPVRKDDQMNEDDMAESTLNWPKLEKAVQLMAEKYPGHFKNILDDNDDAETGDVLVQLALFGELVFG